MSVADQCMNLDQTTARQRLARLRYNDKHVRYRITMQGRLGYCRKGCDPQDWRSWRRFFHVPILFKSEEEAYLYLRSVDIFKNLRHIRKLSASVSRIIINPTR